MMEILSIKTDSKNYQVCVGKNALHEDNFSESNNREVFLVIDNKVPKDLQAKVIDILNQKSSKFIKIEIEATENNKSYASLEKIHDSLIESSYSKECILYALGGGIVCDMTGFAAATYQRGVDFVLIPSTLLSQVDASVGGKTAINHKNGKNMIGAFHQPTKVISEMNLLNSLETRQLKDGLAEIIKHAIILDEDFFYWLELNIDGLLSRDQSLYEYAISQSIKLKESVVSRDETEKGIRKWLNFGHTFGHAIEVYGKYEEFSHGEAVALGMLMAVNLSAKTVGLESDKALKISSLIKKILDKEMLEKHFDSKELLKMMSSDKKKSGDVLNFIVIEGIGNTKIVKNIDSNQILDSISLL